MPKIKIKRQTKYYIFRRFSQGHTTSPSNDFSEIFNQGTKRLNEKSAKDSDPTDDPTDGNASIDSNNSSYINTRTGTPTVSSETKLDLPTNLQRHKSIARSRTPVRHGHIEKLHAFDNTGGHSLNHHRQVGENVHTNYRGTGLAERQNKQSSRGGQRKVHTWNVNRNRVIINNSKDRGAFRSTFNTKRRQRMKKPLSLISFNQVRNNNNINNNNNAAGSVNYNPIDNGIDSSAKKSAQNNCWFVVCLGLYVNDAVFNKNKHTKKKLMYETSSK